MTVKRRITTFVLLLAIVFTMGGELFSAFAVRADAETTSSFESTSIESDLENVDLSLYPRNSLGKCDVISFVEYCYSERSDRSRYYALYIYVYNPTEKPITVTDGVNSIGFIIDEGSGITEACKIGLKCLDKTDNNRFYKFRLNIDEDFLKEIRAYAESNDGARKYEITDLEIKHEDDVALSEVAKIYEFTGYAAYCDDSSNSVSTLECKDYGSRTINLKVSQTNYRFASDGEYIYDELNSVFFTVPEEYFLDFGGLSEITAEWYEYKTDYMFVTSDAEAYSALWEHRNTEIDESGTPLDPDDLIYPDLGEDFVGPVLPLNDPISFWRVLWDEVTIPDPEGIGMKNYFGQAFNGLCRDDIEGSEDYDFGFYKGPLDSWNSVDSIEWLFYVSDVTGADAYRVSKESVIEYMKKYTNAFPEQTKIRDKYASGLFVSSIDSDRLQFLTDSNATSGHVRMNFSIDSTKNNGNTFVDSDKTQSAWNKFWYGEKYETYSYSPIAVIKEGDLVLDAETFSEKYYVNKEDAASIIKNAKNAYDNNERPVLLRFAVTDYYASAARFDYAEADMDMSEQDGYVAQETVFLDFDVLSLTFKSEDGYTETVIGAVAKPIDIINGLDAPEDLVEEEPWWQKLVMLLGIVIIISALNLLSGPIKIVLDIVWSAIKLFISFVVSVITAPFRFIRWLLSHLKNMFSAFL